MPSECPSVAVLAQYATGALSEAEASAVDTHIGFCTACLERMNGLETPPDSITAALRRSPRSRPHDSQSIARAIASALRPAESPGLSSGADMGGYRIVEELGRGGMGRVYRAAHPRLDQEVALKVLRPGLDSAPILARFEAERQTLARMDHPNIARVLDGGATADGQPFFAMELVRGVSITRYADDGTLDLRRRLELFVSTCRAVQHAHEKGIIHRDLKPSNVLIAEYDGKPTVKVIDFGVAKATGRESDAETEVGVLVGTPESMSPEQANLTGGDIDTRTDVYALGGLLYELLTGDTPFERWRLRAAPVLEVLRIVREEEPPAPSARLAATKSIAEIAARRGMTPGPLVKQVRGDLDRIVLKSLEKDRDRRYESASALAADVERYLNDEPVLACPPSAFYRFQKFARRNKGKLAAASVLGLAALLSVSAIGWAVRDRSAREDIVKREEADRQARVNAQIGVILDEVTWLERQQLWPQALAAARRAADLVTSHDSHTKIAVQVQHRIQALELVRNLDDIRTDMGVWKETSFDYRGTDQRYAAAFRNAGIDLERLSPEESADRLRSQASILSALVPALDNWAHCRQRTGDKGGAQSILRVAGLLDPDSWRQQVRHAMSDGNAQALLTLAADPNLTRQSAATITNLAVALRLLGRLDAAVGVLSRARIAHPSDFWIQFDLADALSRKSGLSNKEQAAHAYRTALGVRPGNAASWTNLGKTLGEIGKREEAIECLNKALNLAPDLANTHVCLGLILVDQKKLDEGIACYRRALELDPKQTKAFNNLGVALLAQNKPKEAIDAYKQAIEIDANYALAYTNLGIVLAAQNKLDDAIAAFQKTIELDPDFGPTHFSLGNAFLGKNQVGDAVASYRRAIELNPRDARIHTNLGYALFLQGQTDEAIACQKKAIELDPKLATAYVKLGIVLCDKKKDYDGAVVAFRKAISLQSDVFASHFNLGYALRLKGDATGASAAFRDAIRLQPSIARAHGELVRCLTVGADPKLRNPEEALQLAKKAVQLGPKSDEAWLAMGFAAYRAGDWKASIAALEKSMELQTDPKGGDATQWFFLAMAYWQMGDKDEARRWYDKAVAWMTEHVPVTDELRRIRAEADEVLEIVKN